MPTPQSSEIVRISLPDEESRYLLIMRSDDTGEEVLLSAWLMGGHAAPTGPHDLALEVSDWEHLPQDPPAFVELWNRLQILAIDIDEIVGRLSLNGLRKLEESWNCYRHLDPQDVVRQLPSAITEFRRDDFSVGSRISAKASLFINRRLEADTFDLDSPDGEFILPPRYWTAW